MSETPHILHKKLTMQDVADAAGVSPMTVSNCFRYPDRVREKTRSTVMKIAAELARKPRHSSA